MNIFDSIHGILTTHVDIANSAQTGLDLHPVPHEEEEILIIQSLPT